MRKRKMGRILLWILLGFLVLSGTGISVAMNLAEKHLPEEETDVTEAESETEETYVVPRPDVSEQLLTINEYSRVGEKTDPIKYIVIHYLGNPRTTAQENHDYFESLKDLKNCYMSANYIVGLEGEIIQCVPDDEVAYASNQENHESISIENCHMDSTGKFLKDTYISLVKLTAYLAEQHHLDRDQIIRHHDVTGKDCPLYYTEHEDAWEDFKDDVMTYWEMCKTGTVTDEELEKVLKGTKNTYKDKKEALEEEQGTETEKHEDGKEEHYEEDFEEDASSGIDHTPETSYTPDTGYTPDTSYTPDTGYTPDTSYTSDTGYTPDTSYTPDTGYTPDTSYTPDTDYTPDIPDTPDTSGGTTDQGESGAGDAQPALEGEAYTGSEY